MATFVRIVFFISFFPPLLVSPVVTVALKGRCHQTCHKYQETDPQSVHHFLSKMLGGLFRLLESFVS